MSALHTHQIAVYERLLDLAGGVADAAAYHREIAARDSTLAVVRAEWLDRYRNAACVYAALGDEAQRQAAAARYHAGGQSDFLAAITAMETQSAAALAAARASQEALAPLLTSLLDWRIATDGDARRQRLSAVRGLWSQIRTGDPGCTWERICSHPPYRARIPFGDAGLAMLGQWLADALAGADPDTLGTLGTPGAAAGPLGTAPAPSMEPAAPVAPERPERSDQADPPDASAGSPGPAPPGFAHAYRVVYEAQDWTGRDITRRAYERILALAAEVAHESAGQTGSAAGDAFLCRMAEDGLADDLARAPHLDWAEELGAHCAGRSQPAMAHHAGALAAAMARSPTATAVEHERMWLDGCFHIESAWDRIFVHYALSPIATALAGAPGEGAAVRESIGVTAALFGITWDALLATPRLWDFFCRELVPAMLGRRPALGAFRGEAGSAVVQAAAALDARPASDAPGDVRAHVAALVHAAAGAEPAAAQPGRPGELVLWGQPVTLDAVADRLASPPRPAIALGAPAATT